MSKKSDNSNNNNNNTVSVIIQNGAYFTIPFDLQHMNVPATMAVSLGVQFTFGLASIVAIALTWTVSEPLAVVPAVIGLMMCYCALQVRSFGAHVIC